MTAAGPPLGVGRFARATTLVVVHQTDLDIGSTDVHPNGQHRSHPPVEATERSAPGRTISRSFRSEDHGSGTRRHPRAQPTAPPHGTRGRSRRSA